VKIVKANGEVEHFSEGKLIRSLQRAGASEAIAQEVLELIQEDIHHGMPSHRLQRQAFKHLKQLRKPLAARYDLKRAIGELGPSGYPFERLMGEIFDQQGYTVSVGKILRGKCVQHEVDVVGNREDTLLLVECKYRNTPGYKCDVKVPLYIRSRFEDIREAKALPPERVQGVIATNARFSGDAVDYAACVGLQLIGWDYPKQGSLRDLLDTLKLYPLTVLTELSKPQKQALLNHKLVLCRDILANPDVLAHLPGQVTAQWQDHVIRECERLLAAK
jgi:hypothetical protein